MNITDSAQNYSLFAKNIVKSVSNTVFSNNDTLCRLLKSEYFFKELFELFNSLISAKITPEIFSEIVTKNDFSETDFQRLLLISKAYNMYVNIIEKNGYKLPFHRQEFNFSALIPLNKDIKKRADFLIESIVNKKQFDFKPESSESIKYRMFSDIQDESLFVVEAIKTLIKQGTCSFGEIGVFVDKSEARQKFLDMLKSENIPVISSIYNEHYENMKYRISVYRNISELCIEMGLESFSSDDFKNIQIESRAKKEIFQEEFDEILKNYLFEVLENSYTLEKVLSKKENSKKMSFLGALFSLWNEFSEHDTDVLVKEFGNIKSFYEAFKNNKFSEAISSVIKSCYQNFEKDKLVGIVSGKIKSLNELQNLYDNVLKTKPEFTSFMEILEWLPPDKNKENNAVTLASISKDVKKDYKYIFICGLTENNFPGSNPAYPYISEQADKTLVSKIKNINPEFTFFTKSDEAYFLQRFYAICSLMGKTSYKLVLCSHKYEAKKQTQASFVFKLLSEADSMNKCEKLNFRNETNPLKNSASENKTPEINNKGVVFESDVLKLSASSIYAFQKCPRKFFYKSLLNLKEQYTFAAGYGTIVHSVFEVLGKHYLDSFNRHTALELAQLLLNPEQNEENLLKIGFKQSDIDLIKEADELSLAEMKDNFFDAVEDLEMTGFFDEVPDEVITEKSFSFTLDELPDVVFEGRIDAIARYGGSWRIIDYKTGKDKENSLSYAISENGVNFKTEAGKEPSNVETYKNRYDYQIPIYYLACKNDENLKSFKGKFSHFGLLYVRPKNKDNGCREDFVTASVLEEYINKIVFNLKNNVVEKIINETEFKKNLSRSCENCAYKFLCDEDSAYEQ